MISQQIQVFDFEEQTVRVVEVDGESWFVAADVCRVLEIINSRDAVSRLDDDEKADVGIVATSSNGVSQRRNFSVVSESGLYALIFTSRKPEAKKFRRWVTTEVLPSIRQSGQYRRANTVEANTQPQSERIRSELPVDADRWLSAIREARVLRGRGAAISLWERSPLPELPQERKLPAMRREERDVWDVIDGSGSAGISVADIEHLFGRIGLKKILERLQAIGLIVSYSRHGSVWFAAASGREYRSAS